MTLDPQQFYEYYRMVEEENDPLDWVQKNITGTGYIKVEAQGVSSQVEFNMINDPEGLKNIIFSTRDFVRARKMAFQLKHLREFLTKTIEGFSQSDPPAAETPETKKTP